MSTVFIRQDMCRHHCNFIYIPYINDIKDSVKVRLPDRDAEYIDIVAGVLLRDTLVSCLLIICLDDVLSKSIDLIKKDGFTLKKARSRRCPAETIMGPDYTDDITLLANTPTQPESLLHSLEQAEGEDPVTSWLTL